MLHPASYSSLNLSFIDLLTERYNLPVGFSDHSPGIDAALLSIGKGVKVIEKHFTLNNDQDGNDHKNSLSPEGFKELVNKTRLYEKMLGKRQKIISERESKERIYARRGIYAGRNLKKGERLTLDKLAFLRPNISNGVEKLDDLLDKILNTDIQKGAPINSSMVK